MTKEKMVKKMEELRTSLDEMAIDYNGFVLQEQIEEASKKDKEIADAIEEYNGYAQTLCYQECAEAEDPMLEAVKRLNYKTLASKDAKLEDSDITARTIIEREKPIDVWKLHKRVKGGIGYNKEWEYMIEQLNFRLTARKATELGITGDALMKISDSFAMSDLARQYSLGKNPASNTNLLKTLTAIVQAMIGEEYKPTSHDVNYLTSIYSKKSRAALTVVCATHKNLRSYIVEICHRLVMNKGYGVAYKAKKEQ